MPIRKLRARMWAGFVKAVAVQLFFLLLLGGLNIPQSDSSHQDQPSQRFSDGLEPNWTPITGGLPSAGEHYDVTFGDVNNDGKLDIAASTATGLMHVYVGDGIGNFVEESNGLPGSGSAFELILADFNNDGNLDLAGNARVYLGNGGAGGSMTWTFDSNVATWYAASAADMNLDGKLDLITGGVNGIHVYMGDGGAGGSIIWTDSSAGLPGTGTYWKPVAGDINHDGKPDIVCADAANGIGAWTGNGLTGASALWMSADTGLPQTSQYASVDIGDVNHDGNLDVVTTAYYSSNGVRLWLGNGGSGGSMVWTENSNGLDTSVNGYLGVKLGDINHDGDMDIVVSHFLGNGLRLWLGDGGDGGTMDWTLASAGLPFGNYIDVDVGDFDNDGKLDLVAGLNQGIEVWQNDLPDFMIDTYVSASIGLPNANTWADVQFSDINHDGELDIGFTSFQGQDLGIQVHLGDGTGVWTPSSTGLPTSGSFSGMRFADIDHDGAIDIIAAQEGGGGNNGVHAYRGDGTGSWTEMALVSAAGGAGLELADLNHDGNLDIITGYYQNNWGPMIYLGNGDFTWSGNMGPPGEIINVDDVAVADVNHDGHLDIAASAMNNLGIQLWTGDGTGMPSGWTRNDTGLPTTEVYLGLAFKDVNHDGNVDIAGNGYAPPPGAGVRVWLGNGGFGGTMAWTLENTGLPATGSYGGVEFGDTDVDGNEDILFASSESTGSTGIGYMRGDGGAGGSVIWSNPGVSGIPTTGTHWGIAFGDMDNDGIQDIAATSTSGVRVYKQGVAPVLSPQISFSFPNGMQNWTGNTQHTIWWNLSDDSPPADLTVYLNYTYNAGASSGTIVGPIAGATNPNSYTWTTPLIDATDVILNGTVIDPTGLVGWDEVTVSDIDSNAPSVSFNMPADSAIDVPVDQPLIIQFDESMNRDSVISSLSVIPNPSGWSWIWSSSDYPDDNITGTHDPFDYGQTYIVNVLQTALDASSPGNALDSMFSFSFTTEPPNSPPDISLNLPAGGESWTGNTNHLISFTASDAEDPSSSLLVWLNYSLTGGPPWLPITGPIPGDSAGIIWTVPTVDTFTAIIHADVTDTEDGVGTNVSNTFEIDSTDPFVSSATPANADLNVPTNVVLQATWNELMNMAGTNSSFSLRDNATWTLVTGQMSWIGSIFRFNPDLDLNSGSWYTANFTTVALDDSDPGNNLASLFTWSFRTSLAPDVAPPIIENLTEYPSPVEIFGSINISADIYDDFGVSGAWIEFTPPTGGAVNITLGSLGARFYNESIWDSLGTYGYTISAVDGAGNWNASQDQFEVVDTTPPTITSIEVQPSDIESGDNVNVSALVTDNYLLAGVWISVIDPDQQESNTSMSAGVRYYFNRICSEPGSYSFTIWASDSSGNWASAGYIFAVTSPPPLEFYVIITDPEEGSEFSLGEILVLEGWLREVGTDRGVADQQLIVAVETLDGEVVGQTVLIESRTNGRIIEVFTMTEDGVECTDYLLRVYSTDPNVVGADVQISLTGCRDDGGDDIPIWVFLLILVTIIVVTSIAILFILLRRRRKEEPEQYEVAQTPEVQDQSSDDIEP